MLFPFLQDAPAAPEIVNKLANQDSTRAAINEIKETLTTTSTDELISSLAHSAMEFGLKVAAALAIYLIGGWIIRRIKKGLRRGFERKGTDKTIATFTVSLVTISMWVLVIILTVGSLGINTSSLAALLAAGGLAIGMAMSGTVQNFAGGIMILAFKPFKAGDYIEAQGYAGTVTEVSIASTKLLTVDNRVVVLPNGSLANGNINNFSTMPLRRVDQVVQVAYGIDVEKVKEAILTVVRSNPAVLDATTEGAADPFVSILELGESGVRYVVRVWVKGADYWPVFFYLNETIYTELPKHGVNFTFPQLDVHIKQ